VLFLNALVKMMKFYSFWFLFFHGVQGKFFMCNDRSKMTEEECQ